MFKFLLLLHFVAFVAGNVIKGKSLFCRNILFSKGLDVKVNYEVSERFIDNTP